MTNAPVGWETARLVARRAARDAAQNVFEAYAQDPEVARYMIWRPHRDVASACLLESVGMEREGVLRRWIVHPNISDESRDALCYAVVK